MNRTDAGSTGGTSTTNPPTPRQKASAAPTMLLGCDPGDTAGGLSWGAGPTPDGLGWYERGPRPSDGYRATRAGPAGLKTVELPSLVEALRWLVPEGPGVAVVERVEFRGRPNPGLQAAATLLVDLLRRRRWRVTRPQPHAWRGVYSPTGRVAPMDRGTAKRVAVAALYGRPCTGVPWLVTVPPPTWLPNGVPDHAAEAEGMRRWGR